ARDHDRPWRRSLSPAPYFAEQADPDQMSRRVRAARRRTCARPTAVSITRSIERHAHAILDAPDQAAGMRLVAVNGDQIERVGNGGASVDLEAGAHGRHVAQFAGENRAIVEYDPRCLRAQNPLVPSALDHGGAPPVGIPSW